MTKKLHSEELFFNSNIFNPQAKIIANLDRAIEYFKTGNTPPVLVELDPSNICNHGCSFCLSNYIHAKESKHLPTFNRTIMPEDMLLNVCKELIDMNIKAINWTGGGEPTFNPALKKAINFISKNSQIKMGIFTNGTLINKFNLFDEFADCLLWTRFSVDAGRPETYNYIRKAGAGNDWNQMVDNLKTLISTKKSRRSNLKIGVGFIITPDNYDEIIDFARFFVDIDVDYCQYKPEVVNREREGGIQRGINFWKYAVQKPMAEAKIILGSKFQVNEYKLSDLENDPEFYGRTYEKCIGSQLQPCIGADGYVYVCPNHRGYREYSYGSLHERSFRDIWNDLETRNKIMYRINDIDRFCNCTKLCKAHESNKMMWHIYKNKDNSEEINRLFAMREELAGRLEHAEFI